MSVNDSSRFEFGKNWQSFIDKHFSDERVRLAQQSLRDLLGVENLEGRTFLDVGCGSGLFSLAAVLIGARQVTSFDYDDHSVKTTEQVRAKCNISPDQWRVCQGSILDDRFLATVQPADVVYCWGVAHHTGDMWRAINNVVRTVKPGGLLELSIYNKVARAAGGSYFWLEVKRTYNRSPVLVRKTMEYGYIANFIFRHLVTFRNPFVAIRDWRLDKSRGMDFWHDIRDWLGGYPYEFATAGEVFNYVHRNHGLVLDALRTTHTLGCNEFVFLKPPLVENSRSRLRAMMSAHD